MTDTGQTEVYSAPGDGLTGTVIQQPPKPHLVVYYMDPHIESAFWLILWAIFVLIAGYVIDMATATVRKNKNRDDHR